MSLVCDMETMICGMCLVSYCFQFTNLLKRVLNLVSLEFDLSISKAKVSQTLGCQPPPHPTEQPVLGLLHLLQHQDLQWSRLGMDVVFTWFSAMFFVLCVLLQ